MNIVLVPTLATLVLGTSFCGEPGSKITDDPPTFCQEKVFSMLDIVRRTHTPDQDTQAIKPDAEALRRSILEPSYRGGPSSPDNRASFQRFREFVKKKCNGRDIGPTLPEAVHILSWTKDGVPVIDGSFD